MTVAIVNNEIDVSNNYNLQNKKYDFIRIAFIMSKNVTPMNANSINYYYNKIFNQKYVSTQRIAQILRQQPNLFIGSKVEEGKTRQTKTYTFKGKIKLNKTTQFNWNNKAENYFLNNP